MALSRSDALSHVSLEQAGRALEKGPHQFVRVPGDAVGSLDASQLVAMFRGQEKTAAPRSLKNRLG